ncbi:MAG: hypothetical protein ACPG6P_12245 [Akkermansiaceae bacterium]
MAKDKETKDKKAETPEKKGGCIKRLALMLLFLVIVYLGVHIYFIWQPAGKTDDFSKALQSAKIFPAIQPYSFDHIAGRTEIIDGKGIPGPLLKERVSNAITNKFPITFREEEINAWLSKRLDVKQGGALAPFVKDAHAWVDFKQDEMEIIIERRLSSGDTHVTSMFLKFERSKQGFSIQPYSSHIGQVRAPGGFARLISPAFDNLATELTEELKLYEEIYDISVKDGTITLDPRRPEER